MSILSFPNRGPWGDNRYRGNSSGHIYKALYEQLRPNSIVEVFSGSGTAGDVARELNIPIVELDLKDGFDAARMSILDKTGHESDLVFVTFSGWGLRFYSRQNKTNTVSAEVHLTAETGNGALKGLQPTIRIDAGSGDYPIARPRVGQGRWQLVQRPALN